MGLIEFNGRLSSDCFLVVFKYPKKEVPEKDIEKVHVPGRNGDLLMDLGSYQNVRITYTMALVSREFGYDNILHRLLEWLNVSGYAVLKDDVDKDCFRLARFTGDASEVMKQAWYGGEAELVFDAMPQRFLTVGQKEYTMQKGGILRNPTSYAAKPKIIIAGTGAAVLHVGDYIVNISNIGGNIIIESDIEDAYYGSTNKNNVITLAAFPLLQPGDNMITWTSGITSCKIVPKFWRL